MCLEQQKEEVVNRIQQFDPVSVVLEGAEYLRWLTGDPFPTWEKTAAKWENNPRPWNVMLLLQWTLQYRTRNRSKRRIDWMNFYDICVDIEELWESDEIMGGHKDLHLYLNLMQKRPQQFTYQFMPEEIVTRIARQIIWFVDMDADKDLFWQFVCATKLPPELFLGMCLWCNSFMQERKFEFTVDMFAPSGIPRWAVVKFFDGLSVDLEQVDGFSRRHGTQETDAVSQIVDPTSLAITPFFLRNGRYTLFSLALFAHEMQYISYRLMRKHDAHQLGQCFGPVFEEYVGMGLRYCCKIVRDATWIQGHIGTSQKNADFFVPENSAAIFVDAKSTELPASARVAKNPNSLIGYTRNSLIRGADQVMSTYEQFLKKGTVSPDTKIFGLVVTYGNYFLTWEILNKCTSGQAKRILRQQVLKRGGDPDLVDRVHFLFADSESFDYLVAGVRENKTELTDVLAWVVKQNKDWIRSPLVLKQRLWALWNGQMYFPDYLKKAIDKSVNLVDDPARKN